MAFVLVTGATGFVGSALIPALLAAGHRVRATSRAEHAASKTSDLEWVRCDIHDAADVDRALQGVDAAFFLVHGMGGAHDDYAAKEQRSAKIFIDAAARAGIERVIYLGGVAPAGEPSEHLRSRLMVGEILRTGTVRTLELRASMIIGNGSASWQIVRDLVMRLPAMLLPSWTASRTSPIAIDDVVVALVRGLSLPLPESAWYDIPGPSIWSGREIFLTLAAMQGRRVPSIGVPLLSVSLSSWWLKLITRADFSLARELVLGFSQDLLPHDDRYWDEIDYRPKWTLEAAARRALDEERTELSLRGIAGKLEESVVHALSPKLGTRTPRKR